MRIFCILLINFISSVGFAQCDSFISDEWSALGLVATTEIDGIQVAFESPDQSGSNTTTFSPTGTFNPTNNNYWSNPNLEGATSLQFTMNWDDTPDLSEDASVDSAVKLITINFSQEVTNPILHVDRLGGNFAADGVNQDYISNSSQWTLITQNITATKVCGNPQFKVENNSIYRTPNENLGSPNNPLGGEADGNNGMNGSGAGSVLLQGSFSELEFQVVGIGPDGLGAIDGIEFIIELNPSIELCNCGNNPVNSTSFITTWKTNNPGKTCDSCIEIPTNSPYSYNYDVDWENDGNWDEFGLTGDAFHDYVQAGEYEVAIRGDFPHLNFFQGVDNTTNKDNDKVTGILNWGDIVWQTMLGAFFGCDSLITYTANDTPDLTEVTSLGRMFREASQFNGDISNWDVSTINDMVGTFADAEAFNQDLSNWDVSNVFMLNSTFQNACSFNQDIGNWNVGNVINMIELFDGASSFNQDIGNWDVSSAISMDAMFSDATAFDQDISNWNVSQVTRMPRMFERALSFNSAIGTWDVSNVINMSYIFSFNPVFNQDLSGWDVSNVTNMTGSFSNATAYNYNLGNWNLSSVSALNQMLDNSGLSPDNYESTLLLWSQNGLIPTDLQLGAQNLQYCDPTGRDSLIINNGWTINGDQQECCSITHPDYNGLIELYNQTDGSNWLNTQNNNFVWDNTCDPCNGSWFGIECENNRVISINLFSNNLHGTLPNLNIPNCRSIDLRFNFLSGELPEFNSLPVLGSLLLNNNELSGEIAHFSNLPGIWTIWASDNNFIGEIPSFINSPNINNVGFSNNNLSGQIPDYSHLPDFSFFIASNNNLSGCYPISVCNFSAFDVTDNPLLPNEGDHLPFCNGAQAIGLSCDDGDPDTNNDTIQEDCSCSGTQNLDGTSFITTWKTDNPGKTCDSCIEIPTSVRDHPNDPFDHDFNYTYNYDIDWENDGIWDEFGLTGDAFHEYVTPGIYNVAIRGDFPHMYFTQNESLGYVKDNNKLIDVLQWGDIKWLNMHSMFNDCDSIFMWSSLDSPNLSFVLDMSRMFGSSENFNQEIGEWDVSGVTDLSAIFFNSRNFNQDIGKWNVSNVTNMSEMFRYASNFNQDIGEWDLTNVCNMNYMFQNAENFNQDIGSWNIPCVTELLGMFGGATSFNQNISNWDVSNVVRMEVMFANASNFNQNISNWDVSNVRNMRNMFGGATSFNQNLGIWDISSILDPTMTQGLIQMLDNSGLSRENYEATLLGWAQNPNTPQNLELGAEALKYCDETGRNALINNLGWTINGDSQADDCVFDCETEMVNVGDLCNDNNPNTTNDIVQDDCSCLGTLANNCDDAFTSQWSGSSNAFTSSVDGIDVTFTFSDQVGVIAPSFSPNGSFNVTNNDYWTNNNLAGNSSFEFVLNWDDTPDAGEEASVDAATQTVTIAFSQAVSNPIIHIDRLGGNFRAAGSSNFISNTTVWNLKSQNALMKRLSGNNQFEVIDNTFQRTPNVSLGTLPPGGENDGSNGQNGTAAGSLQFVGEISELQFEVIAEGPDGTSAIDGIEMIIELYSQHESTGLMTFYENANGDNWFNKTGWGESCNPCDGTWYGVSCIDGVVSALYLQDNGLSGTLPNLPSLSCLDTMDVRWNNLEQCIPLEYCNLLSFESIGNPSMPFNGDPVLSCPGPTQLETWGAPCDDSNLNTGADHIDQFCMCNGFEIIQTTCNSYLSNNWIAIEQSMTSGVNDMQLSIDFSNNASFIEFSSIGMFNTNGEFWSNPEVAGARSLEFSVNWDTTPDGSEDASIDSSIIPFEIDFETAVTNPVIHFDRLGANYFGTGNSEFVSFSSEWQLSTEGVTMVRLCGNEQFEVVGNRIFRTPYEGLGIEAPGGEADGSNGENGTGSGSIQFMGTFDRLDFEISGIGPDGNEAIDDLELIIEVNPNLDQCACGQDPEEFRPFITTWKTDNPGKTCNTCIEIPTSSEGPIGNTYGEGYGYIYNYDIDWENDGIWDEFGLTGDAFHDYGSTGTYEVAIRGAFPHLYFRTVSQKDNDKLLDVIDWGDIIWMSMTDSFNGCDSLVSFSAINPPNLENVQYMVGTFSNMASFKGSLDGWNTMSVINMNFLFQNSMLWNSDLSSWDFSNVTDAIFMFDNAKSFNHSILSWDVNNVQNFAGMFRDATSFNQNLGNFNIISADNLHQMLDNSGLSIENYEATLLGWSQNPNTPSNLELGAESLLYCDETGRAALINNLGWTINGDSKAASENCIDCPDISIGDLQIQHPDCENPNSGYALISPEGGQAPYSCMWTGPNGVLSTNDCELINVPSGDYSLTITDSNDCISQNNLIINLSEADSVELQCVKVTVEVNPLNPVILSPEDFSITNSGCQYDNIVYFFSPYDLQGDSILYTSQNPFILANCSFIGDMDIYISAFHDGEYLGSCSSVLTTTDIEPTDCTEDCTNSSLTAEVDVIHPTCESLDAGNICVNVSGGNLPYEIIISDSDTIIQDVFCPEGLPSGNYNIELIDGTNCVLDTIIPLINLGIGEPCDDDDPNTIDDVYQNDCTCSGTPIVFDCPTLMLNIGDACDDSNPNTIDDIIQLDCTCMGTEVDCVIEYEYDPPICYDNMTPYDTLDDYFTVTFSPFGSGFSEWSTSIGLSGSINDIVTLGPQFIVDGPLILDLYSVADSTDCNIAVVINPPPSCGLDCEDAIDLDDDLKSVTYEEDVEKSLSENDTYPPGAKYELLTQSNKSLSAVQLDSLGIFKCIVTASFIDPIVLDYRVCFETCDICREATLTLTNQDLQDFIFTDIISPNGDGQNDVLKFSQSSEIPDSKLLIYNRWGKKIFEADNYSNDWYAEGYPGGIYYYVLELNGLTIKKTLTILK